MQAKTSCNKDQFFYVISFPRSGTTWMVNSLFHFYGAQRGELLSEQVSYTHRVYLENSGVYAGLPLEYNREKPLQVKTHMDRQAFLNLGCPENKGIYIQRDARDVMISYYFYSYGHRQGLEKDFNESQFIDFLHKHLPLYRQHVESWSETKQNLMVHYEDLKMDYVGQLNKIASFLDNFYPIQPVNEVEHECVIKVKRNFTNNPKNFFRRGIIGDWKTYFTDKSYSVYESYMPEPEGNN